jgi:hypothetical protein
MSEQSDTPRTDALIAEAKDYLARNTSHGAHLAQMNILANHACQLERELAEARRDARRFQHLQNAPVVEAQAYFWNYQSRKQRAAAIDAAISGNQPHTGD